MAATAQLHLEDPAAPLMESDLHAPRLWTIDATLIECSEHREEDGQISDFQVEMGRAVQGFVAQITNLARQVAIDTLEAALTGRSSGDGSGTRGRRELANRSTSSPASSSSPTARAGRARDRGAKRSAAELDELAENFAAYVRENPGLRVEQINKQLGTSTKDLALPIRKLLADGTITAKGQKRSTTYFAGNGGGGRKKSKKNSP